jgi:hypothetical protein
LVFYLEVFVSNRGNQYGNPSTSQNFPNRGSFNQFPKNLRGNQSQQGGKTNNSGGNTNRGFQQKSRPPNRGNRGGGN